MAMFTFYGDASGSPDAGVALQVSGYISDETRWLTFEEAWEGLLDSYGIDGPFHTTDYVAVACGNAPEGKYPSYESFRGNVALQDQFEAEAILTIKDGILKPVSLGVILAELDRVRANYIIPPEKQFAARPYPLCALDLMYPMTKWVRARLKARKIGSKDKIEWVYEDNDKDRGIFQAEFKRRWKQLPIMRTKNDHPCQFAAADILAWRHARTLTNVFGQQSIKREFFADLFTHIPHHHCRFLREPNLRELYDRLGFEAR